MGGAPGLVLRGRQTVEEFIRLEPAHDLDHLRQIDGIQENAMEGVIKLMLTPWFRFYLTHDPRATLKKVSVPVLAITGERDLQVVPAGENLAAIAEALKAGGNKDYTVVEVPKLNHLFQMSETGSPAEYGRIEETISPTVLKLIGDWIVKRRSGA